MSVIKAACLQITSGPKVQPNLEMIEGFIREAAASGAELVVTPENSCMIRMPSCKKLETAYTADTHPGVPLFSKLAAELGIWLLIGSLSIKVSDTKLANRSFLFSPEGTIAATYDKIHLFDVQLPTGETHRESDTIMPGDRAVVVDMGTAKIGLSICYDIRFAQLYRDLAKAGAEILTVPAAFTVPTGEAHWQTLLRARAIETGSFVLAPAQVGEHENGRKTWGHSLIIGPWGDILAEGGDAPEIIYGDLQLNEVREARQAIPALQHDRDYSLAG